MYYVFRGILVKYSIELLNEPKLFTYIENTLEVFGEINHPVHVITLPSYILHHSLLINRKPKMSYTYLSAVLI